MKTMTLKIVFSFYSRHWKNEVSYFIRENYVVNVLKKSPRNIMQNLVQTEEYPTILHGYVRKKKQNDNEKNDSADTPNGVDVKCATVNTSGNVISMCVVPVNLTYSCSGKTVRETGIKEMLDKMYNKEVSFTRSKKKEMPQQDMRFMEILDEGTKLKDGHYQIPLPFKQEDVRLPCNKYQAAQRLSYLKRKFDKNEKFKANYIRFMKEIIAKGCARKSTMTATPGKMWYLPHHGVYHPNKPGKTRVVFELSAEYKGTCLNKELLPVPDLTNQIIGVLLRFREGHVGVMGDIQTMFHQVKVPDTQCSFLKFLWWEDSEPVKK